MLWMHSINPFSGSVVGVIQSHASLYFVSVTNVLSGYVMIYCVGGFLLGKRQNGLSGKVIYWREREGKHFFLETEIIKSNVFPFVPLCPCFRFIIVDFHLVPSWGLEYTVVGGFPWETRGDPLIVQPSFEVGQRASLPGSISRAQVKFVVKLVDCGTMPTSLCLA